MLWLAADEDSVVKEGQSADNLKRLLHNSDVLIIRTNSYVHGTEAAFGRSLRKYIQIKQDDPLIIARDLNIVLVSLENARTGRSDLLASYIGRMSFPVKFRLLT